MDSLLKQSVLSALENCKDDTVISDVAMVLQLNQRKMILSDKLIELVSQAQNSIENKRYYTNQEAIDFLMKWHRK